MDLDDAGRYGALRARDPRFDGVFFVGVRTTGIYCRPICPARLPKRDHCTFFRTAAEAEREGYRACLRCRPELAPGESSVDARSRLAGQAVDRIQTGYLNDHGVAELAAELGVSSRHLRRVLRTELGVTPVELAQTHRLAVAKQLLQDTAMPVSRVAFASGFSSIRRFNAVFSQRFSRPPSSIRRGSSRPASREGGDETIAVRLDYRPPLAWRPLLRFLERRATPGIESVGAGAYRRFVSTDDGRGGWVEAAPLPDRASLRASVPVVLADELPTIVAGLRRLFDLDARPDVVSDHLSRDPDLVPSIAENPGLRVPGAYDGFELAVRTILGQQITVEAASALCGRFVEEFGQGSGETKGARGDGQENSEPSAEGRCFPRPCAIASLSSDDVGELGMPRARAAAIVRLARAMTEGDLELHPTSDPAETARRLRSIPGIGPWTVQYILIRALRWPNAFPSGDLGIRRALGDVTAAEAKKRSLIWEPWRAYAAFHLWNRPLPGVSYDERPGD
ncbi:MAG: AlkA N-terminal domain-containing protein [Longimicrobiales bacterium]|nr:AlkA N-terminal domain-containing protein [Longimicrobiales bacterium]